MPLQFHERVGLVRRRRKMTQGEVAEAAGLHRNTVARLERGDIPEPSGLVVAKLARALRCSTDFLLGLVDEIPDGETLSSVAV